jgi:hypothetical protein
MVRVKENLRKWILPPSLQTLMTAALTLTLAWYIAYWYVNKRGVMAGAGAAVAKADKDEAIRDEFGVRPQSRAGLRSSEDKTPGARARLRELGHDSREVEHDFYAPRHCFEELVPLLWDARGRRALLCRLSP